MTTLQDSKTLYKRAWIQSKPTYAGVRMQASPEKTNYTVITPKGHRLAKIAEQLNLVPAGKRIEPSTSVKILGIRIEETGKADIWLQGGYVRQMFSFS